MTRSFNPRIDFTGAPTVGRFITDTEHFIRVLTGPLGSAKSTGCATWLMSNALAQDVDPRTQMRRSRFAIIRSTSPELKTTTIKTWLERWPEDACGPMRYSAPITHLVRVAPRHGRPGLEAEFFFIALDEIKDVAKLRSLDITSAWVNEGSETARQIVQMLRSRVGRFPPRDDELGICARNPSIVIDTNAPDDGHYLVELETERPKGWGFYKQPPAVLECDEIDGRLRSKEAGFPGEFALADGIFAAGRWWVVNPNSENIDHLRPGYYHDQLAGATVEWIQRYLQSKNVFVKDGKPVVPNFSQQMHVFDDLPVLKDSAILLGADIGGGTLAPAALFAQRGPRGNWLIHDELVAADMGVDNFTTAIHARMGERFPGRSIGQAWGDPAGVGKDEIYEVAVFDHMRAKGIPIQPAPSQDIDMRIGAWTHALDRMIDGKPAVMIHRRCRTLIKALAGGWHFKRMQILNEERFHETPNKNHPFSDVGDAGGYMLLGGGEGRHMRRGSEKSNMPAAVVMDTEFDIFNPET